MLFRGWCTACTRCLGTCFNPVSTPPFAKSKNNSPQFCIFFFSFVQVYFFWNLPQTGNLATRTLGFHQILFSNFHWKMHTTQDWYRLRPGQPDVQCSTQWWLSQDLYQKLLDSNPPKCWRWKMEARWRNESAKLMPKVCLFYFVSNVLDIAAHPKTCKWGRKWKAQLGEEEGTEISPPANKNYFNILSKLKMSFSKGQ